LRQQNEQLKHLVAEQSLKNLIFKRPDWYGRPDRRLMRYSPAKKWVIIPLLEHAELPIKKTLKELGIARNTFYAWYSKYIRSSQNARRAKNRSQALEAT